MDTLSTLLISLGMVIWVCGMWQSSRLTRRYRAKTGTDLHPLREITDRYLDRPWLWLIEAPRVLRRIMRIDSTPQTDIELERMRLITRRLYGTGLALFLVGAGLFLVDGLFRPGR